MKLSVIILNWNTRDLLRACLASLRLNADEGTEVIVVDNGSTDGSPAMVQDEFPGVRLLETGQNLGFAGGNNVGLKAARGEYRMLLNSDTEVQPGALERMVACMDRNPKVGACGAQLVFPSGQLQPSGSSFITLRTLLWEQLLLDKAFPHSRVFGEHFLSPWHYASERRLEVLSGACLMMRTACLERIGLLDTNYFMYCEDVDWCLRAHRARWDCIFIPDARILHHHGASSRGIRPEMIRIYNESRCYYFRKFEGMNAAEDAQRLMTLGAHLRQVGWSALAAAGKGSAKEQARNWKTIAERTAAIDLSALPEPGSGEGHL